MDIKEIWQKAVTINWKEKAKALIFETPVEAYIAAAIGAVMAGNASFNEEDYKAGQIPLAFSEIGQTRRNFSGKNQETPPLTMHYSVANDVPMQVFEASNIAHKWKISLTSETERFAYEIEKKVDPSFRVHKLISDYAAMYPGISNAAMGSIRPLTSARQDAQPVIAAFRDSWDESHNDQYRTEVYTEQVCNMSADGKSQQCHSEMRTRQVYDHTIHTYDYDARAGERAAALLRDFVTKYPQLQINEQLMLVTETNAENEWAMRESRIRQHRKKALTKEDYLRLANTWATGSNFNVYMPDIRTSHQGLKTSNPLWSTARRTAHDERYRTGSHSDSGPEEYQVAEAALDYAVEMSGKIDRISGGINYAGGNIPVLNQKIEQFVAASLHGGEGNPEKLRREIMQLAREIYKENFAAGMDTEPAKWGWVVLWSVLGGLAGGGLGLGADRLINASRFGKDYEREKAQSFRSSIHDRFYN